VLRALADLLRHNLHSIDTVARYGGEEFVLILPECDLAPARATAERLRQLVAEMPLQLAAWAAQAALERVTISLGVALAPQHSAAPGGLVQAADVALYAAKRAGKNQVEAFHGPALILGSTGA
jgi:diguanylate cyclase (GGDEF)-like protein